MFDYYDVGDMLGQPNKDAFYDSFYGEQTKDFICFDKYIYPKKTTDEHGEQLAELEDKLYEWEYRASNEYEEYYSDDYGEPVKVNSLLEWDDEKDSIGGHIMCYGYITESLEEEFEEIVRGYDVEVLDKPKQIKKAS